MHEIHAPIHSPRGYKGCGHRYPWKGRMAMGQVLAQPWLASKLTRTHGTQPSLGSQVLSYTGSQVRRPPHAKQALGPS